MKPNTFGSHKKRRGAIVVLVAFMVVVILVAAAFSIDVAYMQCVRAELRAATDASAQAGVEALSRTQSKSEARIAAKTVAKNNYVAGARLKIRNSDVKFGRSDSNGDGTYSFVQGGKPFNAVKVFGRRTEGSRSGVVSLFLGAILGTPTFHPECSAVASHLDQDVCLVIDRSHSMCWDLSSSEWSYPIGNYNSHYCKKPHATLSRWAANASAVDVFVNALEDTEPTEYVALVTFGSSGRICSQWNDESTIESTLSSDYDPIPARLAALGSVKMPGGTNIGAGIDAAVTVLTGDSARTYSQKTIIVMTDGRWTSGDNPTIAAQAAADMGIRVHTITFSDQADQTAMINVASMANGKHFHAPDSESLVAIYEEIALTLPVVLTK